MKVVPSSMFAAVTIASGRVNWLRWRSLAGAVMELIHTVCDSSEHLSTIRLNGGDEKPERASRASRSARGLRGRGSSRTAEECQPPSPDLVRGATEPDEMRLGIDVEQLVRAAERGEARGVLGRDRGVVRAPDDQRRLLDRVVARARVFEVEHEPP